MPNTRRRSQNTRRSRKNGGSWIRQNPGQGYGRYTRNNNRPAPSALPESPRPVRKWATVKTNYTTAYRSPSGGRRR